MINPKDQEDLKKLIRGLRIEDHGLSVDLRELRDDIGLQPKRIKTLVMTYPKVLRKYTKTWWEYIGGGYSPNLSGGDKRIPAVRSYAQLVPSQKNPYPKEENIEEVVSSWKNYVSEVAEDPSYDQNVYNSLWNLRIVKGTGGDKAQTQNEIRSIPNVTTVSTEGKLQDAGNSFIGIYKIKFALEKPESAKTYVEETLKPSLKSIKGLSIIALKGIEKIK